ncbi:hypothetical protein PBY51_010103 [Eleginops maclovinus]|uniref:Uncharacterized protein n=1 Tax=Eleginops maclovinus TaxID=56733 RepID=A0AAN7XVD1_ELEMC|nr:hypothetical protein PBY51_010103 [Eleginops maclovinus]
MRPTTSTMLQQNNNNNYPCLNVSGSTRDMLQKCSRASLPFPSRLELGLGDLPLIRGLRAWALCSKNRRKAGGLLGGGQAPIAPPAGRGGSTSCPRPADVYLSGEWGRMGYGLPLGLDARQAGLGALVTVATLKTSEGSGKTQTQCLFLRTEKGSCLYSTAKPSSGGTTSAASSVVGGWLRGKTGGGGGRDIPGGRKDNGPTPPAHTGVNRVRVRSGRRWRKSNNAREKAGVSRERQQSSREDPAGEISLEERQEEQDKGCLASKQFPSPKQDSRRARQEKDAACRSPRCCHNASPRTCTRCVRRAQRRESQDGNEGRESPRRGTSNRIKGEGKGMRKEMQRNEEEGEEEKKGGLCGLESSHSVLAEPDPDLESTSGCDDEETGKESIKELKTQTSQSKDDSSDREEDTNSEGMKVDTGNTDFIPGPSGQDSVTLGLYRGFDDRSETPCEEVAPNMNGYSDLSGADHKTETERERVDVEEEEGGINWTPAEFPVLSDCYEDVPTPVEGSTCNAKICVQSEQENSRTDHLEGYQKGGADPGIIGKGEMELIGFVQPEPNCAAAENNTVNTNRKPLFFFQNAENASELEERGASSKPPGHLHPSIFETDERNVTGIHCNCSTTELYRTEPRDELVLGKREVEVQEGDKEENGEMLERF